MIRGLVFNIKKYALNDGPGIRTTIYLKGCFLKCKWCDNPEGQKFSKEIAFNELRCGNCQLCVKNCPRGAIEKQDSLTIIDWRKCDLCGRCVEKCPKEALIFFGQEMTVEEVIQEIEKDRPFYQESGGGVTFCGGEPLLQIDFLFHLLQECKKRNFHTCVDTSGYAPWSFFERIYFLVDLFLYDLKVMDEKKHLSYIGRGNQLIKNNLAKLASKAKTKIIIRVPLISGFNDDEENVNQMIEFLTSLEILKIDLIPYHKLGFAKYRHLFRSEPSKEFQPPSKERLKELKEKLENLGFSVRIV